MADHHPPPDSCRPAGPPRSFLLQLSLLDLGCSGYSASLRAAAALSASLAHFGHPEWPAPLQAFGSYTPEELTPCRAALCELQATQPAQQLRPLWRQQHESHGYQERAAEWAELLRVFACPSRVLCGGKPLDPGAAKAAGGEGRGVGGTLSPAPEDVSAMMVD